MAYTNHKTKLELINSINKIKEEYQKNKSILYFYSDVSKLNYDIMEYVSTELYEDFKNELRCVFHQSIYNDDEYTNHTVNDCINVLDTIIDTMTSLKD